VRSAPRLRCGTCSGRRATSASLLRVILNAANRHRLIGHEAALAVGVTIALCGFIGATLTGPSMNPARSLGPAIVSGKLEHIWVFVVGPLLGALAATAVSFVLHPHREKDEQTTAQGDGEK
jgi:glycerol uptake facilitator-like aquaporin